MSREPQKDEVAVLLPWGPRNNLCRTAPTSLLTCCPFNPLPPDLRFPPENASEGLSLGPGKRTKRHLLLLCWVNSCPVWMLAAAWSLSANRPGAEGASPLCLCTDMGPCLCICSEAWTLGGRGRRGRGCNHLPIRAAAKEDTGQRRSSCQGSGEARAVARDRASF